MTAGPVGIVVGLSSRGPVKTPAPKDSVFASITEAVKTLFTPSSAGSFVESAPWDSDGIYDAVARSLARLQQQTDPRRAMIIISDGAVPGAGNINASAGANLIETAKRANFPIYFLSVGSGRGSVSKTLRMLAESSGGEVLVADPRSGAASLNAVSAQLLDKLNRRYVIGYSTPNRTREGKWRKIRVKVDPPPRTRKISVDLVRKQYFDGPGPSLVPTNPVPSEPAAISSLFPAGLFPDKIALIRGIDPDEGVRIGDASRLLSAESPVAGALSEAEFKMRTRRSSNNPTFMKSKSWR